MLRGAQEIITTIKEHLGVELEGTTEDGLFTLSEVECLGACVNAPMMQVNNEWFYEDLTPENTVQLLERWQNGEENTPGPQIERNVCEGPQGRTSLLQPFEHQAHDRDFDQAASDWEASKSS